MCKEINQGPIALITLSKEELHLMEGKKLGKSNRSICALYVFEKLNRRWKTKRK